MEAAEARKNIKPANDLIKALGIKDLQQHFLKHREFFTEQEIKEYYQNFQKFDADNDGMISAADITRISAKMGEKVDKQKLTQLMHPKKPNENISFDDFLDIMRDVHHGTLPADKGFAHLYFRGKDLIKFPSEFRLKEISPTFHSTTSDELCVLMCFINMILQGENLEGLPLDCDQVRELQKLCDGRILCRLLNHLREGLVPLDKFCDKPDMTTTEMTSNQNLCLAGAAKYGCDVKDIDAFDLSHGVEYRLLALLSQIHQVAKAKLYKLDKHIEDYAKQMKEKREKAQPQQLKGLKFERPKKARGERRRIWRQKSAAKKKEAKEISHFAEGTDPEEFLVGWCNFHLKKFHIEVGNLGVDFVDGMNWLYLMNSLDNKTVTNDLLNRAKQLSFDEADKRGEMVLDFAKQLGVKIDITPVDIVKGDALINFAFVNQLYNLFAAGKQSVQDIIKMQNECLGYLIKGINDLEDLEMLMDDEITSLKENVDNLEDSLAGIVGELLVDEISAMTGINIPSMTMQALTPANSKEMFAEEEEPIIMQRRIPSAPPLLLQQGPAAGVSVVELLMDEPEEEEEEEALEEAFEDAIRETQSMEGSLQAQMMDLMQQVKTLMDAQREAAIPKPVIPATIKREVDQAATRSSELQLPEKEGLAFRKGVLKWKPCKVIVKNNRLFVFKAGRTTPSEDIYLSEAIKISQEPTTHGYYALRLTLSLTDSVILGWSNEFVLKEWYTFLSTKIRPTITRTDFMVSGQRMVPHNAVQYQRVAASPAVQPVPTGAEFLEAVTEGDIPAARQLLEKGVDPLITNSWGGNCLHIAAAYGNKDMMKFLTDNLESKHLLKFLIDQPTHFEKNTPLHLAVKTGDARLCQMLLDKAASKELKNQDNETASELATSRGSLEVMAIFSPPSVPPAPAMPAHNHPFLLRGAPMAAYRPQMGASQSPYILPSSSPYYRYRTQPF